jgi:hypothetical protein
MTRQPVPSTPHQRDTATAHTNENNSMPFSQRVVRYRLISRGLWPSLSTDLNPCNIYGSEILKDEVYSNNANSEDNMKGVMQVVVPSVSSA